MCNADVIGFMNRIQTPALGTSSGWIVLKNLVPIPPKDRSPLVLILYMSNYDN